MSLILPIAFYYINQSPDRPTSGLSIYTSYLSSNDNFFIGGDFDIIYGQPVSGLCLVFSNLTTDSNFIPAVSGVSSFISTIAVSSGNADDFRFIVGGKFDQIDNQINTSSLAVVNPVFDGSKFAIPSYFSSLPNRTVYSIYYDDKIYVGGNFTKIGSTTRTSFAAYNKDGTLNSLQHNTETTGGAFIEEIIPDPLDSTSMFICGSYNYIGQPLTLRRSISKVSKNTNNVITTFNANTTISTKYYIKTMTTDRTVSENLIIGISTGEQSFPGWRKTLCKLNRSTGAFISSYNDSIYSHSSNTIFATGVSKVKIDNSGRLLASVSISSGGIRTYRFNVDGSVDNSFNTIGYVTTNNRVEDIIVDSNNNIYLLGSFSIVNDLFTRNNIAKFQDNGGLL